MSGGWNWLKNTAANAFGGFWNSWMTTVYIPTVKLFRLGVVASKAISDAFVTPKPVPQTVQLMAATAAAPTTSQAIGGFIGGVVGWFIGENLGAAWRSFTDFGRVRTTSFGIPEDVADAINSVPYPADAAANGMHAWHAGSNAAAARQLGAVGSPLILLVGLIHETPLDWGSFKAEQSFQGTMNHFLDSVTDIVAERGWARDRVRHTHECINRYRRQCRQLHPWPRRA